MPRYCLKLRQAIEEAVEFLNSSIGTVQEMEQRAVIALNTLAEDVIL